MSDKDLARMTIAERANHTYATRREALTAAQQRDEDERERELYEREREYLLRNRWSI